MRAWDTSAADTPIGKQVERWYTHSGGIWQPVWLEGRPEAHITRIKVTTTSPDTGTAEFEIGVRRDPHPADEIASFGGATSAGGAENGAAPTYTVRVTSDEGAFPDAEAPVTLAGGEAVARLRVVVPDPRLWSPESPHLYDCVVTLTPQLPARDGGVGAPPSHTVEQEEDAAGDAGHAVPPARVGDAVRTYFGLRAVGSGRWGGKPYEYVLLNGAPVYLRGALDQAFHPDGLHAYPSDAAIRADVQAAKALGLNLLRCHIKVNDPRYYYWCDRLGVLMMYDLPQL